jgi:hypothetical protein
MYHVMSRGNRRADICLDDVDRQDFLKTLAAPEHRPGWLRVDRLLGEHGIQKDSPAGRREFECQLERRRLEEVDEASLQEFRRGWCLGGEAFRREMLEQMEGKLGEDHPGEFHRESAEAKARRIIDEELARAGWSQSDLVRRRKSDPVKLVLAARLRNETTLTVKEIAGRLHLGKPKWAKSNLQKWLRGNASAVPAQRTLGI